MVKRGLVIGAGGVTGLAWSSGTLVALEERTGWDPRTADVLLGTSQGAFLSGLLASGIGTATSRAGTAGSSRPHPLRARAHRKAPPEHRVVCQPASPGLLLRAIGPRRIAPIAALGLLPAGTGLLDGFLAPLAAASATGRVDTRQLGHRPRLRLGASRLLRRSRAGDRRSSSGPRILHVPASSRRWSIDGRRYIDGGAHSTTNADLVLEAGLDEVVVLAPMAGEGGLLQRVAHRQLRAEREQLERAGVSVQVVTPSAPDRALMDTRPLDLAARRAIFERALVRTR